MISINYKDSKPIYEQIADSLRMQIVKQIILPDEKLPSVREIAGELSINPNTIQRAIRLLEQEEYVYTVSGRGTFAAHFDEKEHPQRKEFFEVFDKTVCGLYDCGVDEKELVTRVRQIYEGRSK